MLVGACLLASVARGDEAPVYRVDVIVFAHLGGQSDQRLAEGPADYSAYPDPLTNARASDWSPPDEQDPLSLEEQSRRDALATLDQIRALENIEQRSDGQFRGGPAYPPQWVGLEAPTPEMARSWQRLVDSSRHTPLAWRSWFQALDRGDRGAWSRISAGSLLDLDWLEAEAVAPEFLPEQPPYPFLLPRSWHRLDGVIRLRQRQFMHIDVDLVWQTPVEASPSPLAADWYQPAGIEIHPLKQSRSIRPGRIEYFDSSQLGMLLRVERWESPAIEGAAENQSP